MSAAAAPGRPKQGAAPSGGSDPHAVGERGGNTLLEIKGLGKTFGSGPHPVRAVEGVSFSIQKGETLGLVGESGSGKSTIGRLLTRLTDPSAGQMLYHGGPSGSTDLARLSERQYRPLRANIQMIFQDPYASLNPRMRIGRVLAEALDTHGLAPGAARLPRIHELLDQVGLRPEHAERFPHEFSGGQRQRIGIARALAVQPQFIVADEPLSALDVSIQAQVVNLLDELKTRLGLTLLFISHDLDVVEFLCDRVVVLYLGRVMEIAPTAALYAQPRHPYTQALLAAAPIPDPAQRRTITPLQGDLPSPANPPSGCVFRTRCPQAEARCASADMALREAQPGHWHACWKDVAPTFAAARTALDVAGPEAQPLRPVQACAGRLEAAGLSPSGAVPCLGRPGGGLAHSVA